MKKEKRIEFYNIEEMGKLVSPYSIFLFPKFLQEKLGANKFDVTDFRLKGKKSTNTNIGCPFCKKGVLKLINVEPQYSGGLEPVPTIMQHFANQYNFICSNPGCSGRFGGIYQWKFID